MAPIVVIALSLALAAVHVAGGRLRSANLIPRRWWLSVGSGVSVAYVFVHLVPELTERQFRAARALGPPELLPIVARERLLFIAVLVGFTTYYGIELFVRRSQRDREAHGEVYGAETRTSAGMFWVHLGAFAAYNLLIGYLLVEKIGLGLGTILAYAVAIGMHLLVNDYGLQEHHLDAYRHVGRWVLAAAVLVGTAIGFVLDVPDLPLSLLFAFLGGGIVMNVIKEELPEERQSRFAAFTVGVLGYTAVLLVA